MRKVKKVLKKSTKKGAETIRGLDAFGTPVTVNYDGEDTYKSYCGGLCTLIIFIVVLSQFIILSRQMVNRDKNEYVSYFLPTSRGPSNALNIPDLGGQMYIGIKQVTEQRNGSLTEQIIPFDESYINGKIDYFLNGNLFGRKNMTRCDNSNRDDFNSKVKYTSGLEEADFANMVCVPPEQFLLYNSAEDNAANSISILFEQCGGKYSTEVEPVGDLNDLGELLETQTELAQSQPQLDGQLDDLFEEDALAVIDLTQTFKGVADGTIAAGTTPAIVSEELRDQALLQEELQAEAESAQEEFAEDVEDAITEAEEEFVEGVEDAQEFLEESLSQEELEAELNDVAGQAEQEVEGFIQNVEGQAQNVGDQVTQGVEQVISQTETTIPASTVNLPADLNINQPVTLPKTLPVTTPETQDSTQNNDLGAFGGFRRLQPAAEPPAESLTSLGFGQTNNGCKSADEMRAYMADKVIVVYVAQSYVAQEDQEPNENELITFLTPIVEKRLDWRYSKTVNTLIQEVQMEIQDSFWQIFNPDSQELEFTKTSVYNEDVVSREYLSLLPQTSPSLVNTRNPMLSVNFKLDTTLTIQERTAYDSLTLFGDIGGLNDFVFLVLAPVMAFILGNRYQFQLFSQLYLLNEATEQEMSGCETQRQYAKKWTEETATFKWNTLDVVRQNFFVRLLMGRLWSQKKDVVEKVLEIGQERVDRHLDVRSLIMSQNLLLALLKLLVKPRNKRRMMYVQRKLQVIEPASDISSDSSDDENKFRITKEQKVKDYILLDQILNQAKYGDPSQLDDQMRDLLMGAVGVQKKKKKTLEATNRGNSSVDIESAAVQNGLMADAKDGTQVQDFDQIKVNQAANQSMFDNSNNSIAGLNEPQGNSPVPVENGIVEGETPIENGSQGEGQQDPQEAQSTQKKLERQKTVAKEVPISSKWANGTSQASPEKNQPALVSAKTLSQAKQEDKPLVAAKAKRQATTNFSAQRQSTIRPKGVPARR